MEKLAKPADYSLRQLLYFVTIAEEGTISAAAQRLHVSQSAVSLALNELERALKTQVCVRRKAHGITLTPSGSRVLHQARSLLRQAEELESEAANPEGQLSGPLLVGCFMALSPTLMPRLVQGFGQRHPRVTIDFAESAAQDELQRQLLDGELDLALLYDVEVQPEIERRELFRVRPNVLLPADHRLADQPTVALRDLVDEPMVLLQAPPSSRHALLMFQQAGVAPLVRYRVTNFETARALVGRGLGYAVALQRPPYGRTYEGLEVVYKDIAELSAYEVAVLLGWPRHTKLARRAGEFIRYSLSITRSPEPGQPPQS